MSQWPPLSRLYIANHVHVKGIQRDQCENMVPRTLPDGQEITFSALHRRQVRSRYKVSPVELESANVNECGRVGEQRLLIVPALCVIELVHL